MGIKESTYSTIFIALSSEKESRIIEQRSSTEIINELKIDSGLFSYHLDSLKELINKGSKDKYNLSKFGKEALILIRNVEEPIRNPTYRSRAFPIRFVITVFLVLIMILSGLYINLNLNFSQIKLRIDEQENEIGSLRDFISRFSYLAELKDIMDTYISIVSSYTIKYNYYAYQHTYNVPILTMYSPIDNLTLQIYLSNLPENLMCFPLTLQRGKAFVKSSSMVAGKDEYNQSYLMAPIVWSFNISENKAYYALIPSKGWYTLSLTGPIRIMDSGAISYRSIGYLDEKALNNTSQIKAMAEIRLYRNNERILFAIWQ